MGELARFFVTVGSKYDPAGMNQLIDHVNEVEKRNQNMYDGFTKVGVGLTAMSAVGVGAIAFLTKEYAGSQEAELGLADAMRRRGIYTDELYNKTLAYAKSIQLSTGASGEDIKSLQTVLVNYGIHGAQLDKLTMATIDFAKAKGVDLVSAGQLVGRTVTTEADAMSKYGIEVKGAQGSTERMTSLQMQLNETFGGTAVAKAQGLTGQYAIMRQRIGELSEDMGKNLAPTMTKLNGIVGSGITYLENMSSGTKALGAGILVAGTAISGMLAPIALLIGQIPAIVIGFAQVRIAVLALQASFGGLGLILLGVTAGLSALTLGVEAYQNSSAKARDTELAFQKTMGGKMDMLQKLHATFIEKRKDLDVDSEAWKQNEASIASNERTQAKLKAQMIDYAKESKKVHAQKKVEAVEVATMSQDEINLAIKRFTIEEESGNKTLAQKKIYYQQLYAFAKKDGDQQIEISKVIAETTRKLQEQTFVGGWALAYKDMNTATINWRTNFVGIMTSLQSSWASSIQGMITGAQSFQSGIGGIFEAVKATIQNQLAQILANWLMTQARMAIAGALAAHSTIPWIGLALGLAAGASMVSAMNGGSGGGKSGSSLPAGAKENSDKAGYYEKGGKFIRYAEGGMSLSQQIAQVDAGELHLPLNSPQTIKALSSAMKEAGAGGGSDGAVTVGAINVTIKTDKVDSSNAGSIAQQIADEIKRKTPEAIRLAKLAFKTGQAYAGESV